MMMMVKTTVRDGNKHVNFMLHDVVGGGGGSPGALHFQAKHRLLYNRSFFKIQYLK